MQEDRRRISDLARLLVSLGFEPGRVFLPHRVKCGDSSAVIESRGSRRGRGRELREDLVRISALQPDALRVGPGSPECRSWAGLLGEFEQPEEEEGEDHELEESFPADGGRCGRQDDGSERPAERGRVGTGRYGWEIRVAVEVGRRGYVRIRFDVPQRDEAVPRVFIPWPGSRRSPATIRDGAGSESVSPYARIRRWWWCFGRAIFAAGSSAFADPACDVGSPPVRCVGEQRGAVLDGYDVVFGCGSGRDNGGGSCGRRRRRRRAALPARWRGRAVCVAARRQLEIRRRWGRSGRRRRLWCSAHGEVPRPFLLQSGRLSDWGVESVCG